VLRDLLKIAPDRHADRILSYLCEAGAVRVAVRSYGDD